MEKCPFCNQVIKGGEEKFADSLLCGACQAKNAQYWQHGERLQTPEPMPED